MNKKIDREIIIYLIEKGADLNAKDFSDKTPLEYAIENKILTENEVEKLKNSELKGILNINHSVIFKNVDLSPNDSNEKDEIDLSQKNNQDNSFTNIN